MAVLWGKSLSKMEILQRVGDIRQIAQIEPFELVDGIERGVRAVRLQNAAGLTLVVAADRGMAITELCYRGIPLPFYTGVGVAHPAFSETQGMGFLRAWPGGFLTPCGLNQVGSPVSEPDYGLEGESLGLHGRLSGIPAREVRWGGDWKEDNYWMWVEGQVHQVAMFGERISMHRRIAMWLDGSRFWIEDTVENQGFKPVPHMFLQHFNLGFPLVDTDTVLELPEHTTEPRDDTARTGIDSYNQFEMPQAGYQEQVFYHNLQADLTGQVEVRLRNPAFDGGRGLRVTWKYALADYPFLVQWKMMGEGEYVAGIEPANCHVEGRPAERARGTLQVLQPHEARRYTIEVGFSQ